MLCWFICYLSDIELELNARYQLERQGKLTRSNQSSLIELAEITSQAELNDKQKTRAQSISSSARAISTPIHDTGH